MSERDFDFLFVGDTHWVEFDGTMRARPILGGRGNVDENDIGLPEGRYEACTVRLYDQAAKLWSIHWVDGRAMRLDAPLVGSFADGVGWFYGDDSFEGRAIRIRFLWSEITPRSVCWEQSFSGDGGQSWESNWVMRFERVP
jgi:hypothetical protein